MRFPLPQRTLLLLLTLPATVIAQDRQPADILARVVDSVAAAATRDGLTPAIGIAIVREGRVLYARAHGLADATAGVAADDRTLWYLASTSKSFMGLAVSLLADQGTIAFDAPITTLLPGVRWHPDARAGELTLGRFLSHTHHLDGNAVVLSAAFTGAIPEQDWPSLLAEAAPAGHSDLVYTNFGYNVAGMVVDARRPEGWKRFLEQSVFHPAGMHDTFARVSGLDPRRIARPHQFQADGRYVTEPFQKTDATMNAAGGHLATLADLARWTIVQMDSGRIDGRQVFPASAVERSHRLLASHTRDQSRRFAFFDREGWSAGWDIGSYEGERMVSRFGSYHNTRSHLGFLPNRRIGVVAMSTGGLGSSLTDVIAALVYDLDRGRPDAHARAEARLADLRARLANGRLATAASDSTRAARQLQPLGRPLSDFAGRFTNPAYGTMEFVVRNGRLEYTWGVLRGLAEIFDAATQQMRIEMAGTGTPVRFHFAGQGPAGAIVVQSIRFERQ